MQCLPKLNLPLDLFLNMFLNLIFNLFLNRFLTFAYQEKKLQEKW